MKFEELRKNFLDMEFEERLSFLTTYVENRTADLRKVEVKVAPAKKAGAKKDKQIKLTSAQMDLLRKMGLI
jgi:hypothetical protein